MASSSGNRIFTAKATNQFVKFLSKLISSGRGEGHLPPKVPQFTQAGWIFCSFAPHFPKFTSRSVVQSKLLKSQDKPFLSFFHQHQHLRGLRSRPFRSANKAQNPETLLEKSSQIPHRFNNMDRLNYIFKPVGFTALVGTSSIVGCTIWQYEEYRNSVISGRFSLTALRDNTSGGGSTSRSGERRPSTELADKAEAWWSSLSPGEKIFWPICALNTVVWAAWRVNSWAPTMVSYFSSTPVGRRICLPLLLSTFSHYSFFHLAANMFVLHSFIPAAAQILGKEQFVAMYLTSGTIASLGSHFHKLFVGNAIPSLGASGAIMGILGLVCTRMPDIQLGIIFLPGVQFTADSALKAILAVDCAGVLLGWKFMDHAAHLSGCLFGIGFSHWGGSTFWAFRDFVMTEWHKFRMSS